MDVKQLVEDLKAEVELTEDEKVLVEQIVLDSTLLTTRLLAGEEVESELALVKATVLNLAEAKRAKIQMAINDMLLNIVQKVIAGAFASM